MLRLYVFRQSIHIFSYVPPGSPEDLLVCFLHLDVMREQHLEELRFYADFTRYHNAEEIVKYYENEMIHLLQFIPQNKYCFVNQEFFFLKAILIAV